MKGKKSIPRVDRNIRNNLVKFADNLPFRYFKSPQKTAFSWKMSQISNGMKIHNSKYTSLLNFTTYEE